MPEFLPEAALDSFKRRPAYQPSERSGAWVKMRVNRAQEFAIGGRHFDALIFGYWEGDRPMYGARARSGFTPALREQLHQRFQGWETAECPFANLPEARVGRHRA